MCGCVGGSWVQMVVAGEVGKDKAVAGGGIVIFFLDAPCVCGLQGQEAKCIVVAFF